MTQHLPILPILLPMLAALVLLGLGLDEQRQRLVSLTATLLLCGLAALLLYQAGSDEIRHYALGNWQAPYGITLTLDRLAALMVLLTAILALGCVTFACAGEDAQGSHFHGLFQLQLMGLNGAFLTGDLFNLFVFFEILLLASYALLMHGGGKARVAAGLHYVVLNLIGSALFLIALGVLYGATGTLNMVDMGQRLAALDGDQAALATTGALLLVVVFSLKAAALPLYFWLPSTYAAAPAPVAALFTIMTKVGVYALLRVESLVFAGTGASVPIQTWLWSAGLATLALAMIGALGARDLRMLVAYLVLISVGALLVGLGMGQRAGDAALLYYLLHSTLVTAALFLIAELIDRQRGQAGTRLVCGRRLNQRRLLGGLFLVAAIGAVGLPPLSGALAKLWLLQAADTGQQAWLWPLLLLATLAALIALSRAGSVLFWASHKGKPGSQRVRPAQLTGVLWLLATLPLLVIFAGPVSRYAEATADQLARTESMAPAALGATPGARP
ncbi:monovalent cation/H+ antiporter subunit D [Halomonas sp. ML-15]|uniref:monovalent cation/H+ antiporter subunit D n=1 Tax=Halomonas sp. ML-15 TaxID=2773305 RepID=UPI0017477DCC|nr:monovalent cation/H+ antiporter subunit D [Halomonas sp. ML-15]MBD3894823.1 monovalent cation/H+ antiporter subunit D [Halomonas sp. ML-15]